MAHKIVSILIVGLLFCLSIPHVLSEGPLELLEDESTVKNSTTGESWTYREFISMVNSTSVTFNAGDQLEFKLRFEKVGKEAIPPNYYLNLYTDLSNPCWVFETAEKTKKHCDNTWGVWRSVHEHGLNFFTVILTATAPYPIHEELFEPKFDEEFKLSGIARKDMRISIDLFDGKEHIQGLTPDLMFQSTTETLEKTLSETKDFLQQSKDIDSILSSGFEDVHISLDALRMHIQDLAEEGGRPGWAHILAEDMYTFHETYKDVTPRTPPPLPSDGDESPWGLVTLFAIIFAVVGLTTGYMLKRPYVPYEELDDASRMVEDIKNKINVLGYNVEEPELKAELSDLSSKDLAYLRNKLSTIEYLITREEPEMETSPEEEGISNEF